MQSLTDLSCVCPTWKPVLQSLREIGEEMGRGEETGRGRREAKQVECLCTMSNTKAAVTRKCPRRSAMMVVETDR